MLTPNYWHCTEVHFLATAIRNYSSVFRPTILPKTSTNYKHVKYSKNPRPKPALTVSVLSLCSTTPSLSVPVPVEGTPDVSETLLCTSAVTRRPFALSAGTTVLSGERSEPEPEPEPEREPEPGSEREPERRRQASGEFGDWRGRGRGRPGDGGERPAVSGDRSAAGWWSSESEPEPLPLSEASLGEEPPTETEGWRSQREAG